MCLSCGCGKPNDNHGDTRNITQQDVNERNISMHEIEAAAQAAGTTPEKVMENMNTSTRSNLPHHAWGEARDNIMGSSEIDYGISQSTTAEEEQALQQQVEENRLLHYTDESGNQRLLRDGYAETQGKGYGSTEPQKGHPQTKAQEGYDPTHSGVRHAHNRPGERVESPGRETGTAYGEGLQNGQTDAPDRRNPAN